MIFNMRFQLSLGSVRINSPAIRYQQKPISQAIFGREFVDKALSALAN
jgi:hypothetical protein